MNFLKAMAVTAAIAIVLYSVLGIGDLFGPPADGVGPVKLIYVTPDR